MHGHFSEDGETSVNVEYCPKDYSGVKKAKLIIITETNCSYFDLVGKFKK